MTDRNDILRQIHERIGSESTDDLAEAMLSELEAQGGIEFDAQDGYWFVLDDDDPTWGGGQVAGWDDALKVVIEGAER